ncbi:MAG: hypothetical protein BGO09_08795 [Bacteroidetes bacterium 47-18]|nr:MAG: hypothetical protein BGO09_08795 [Bacteroidetes bacterium 47-18]
MKIYFSLPILLLWITVCLSCNRQGGVHRDNGGTVEQALDSALQICRNNASIPADTFGKYSRLAVQLAAELGDENLSNLAHFHLAHYYFNTNNYDSAIQLCNMLLLQIHPPADTGFLVNKVNIMKCTIQIRKGNYKQALDCFFDILPEVEQTGRQDDIYRLYNNIGACNRQMLRHTDAIRWYMRNVDIPEEKYAFLKAASVLNIADCYIGIDNVDSALKYAHIALELSSRNKLLLIQANTLNTFGKILNAQGKTAEAIRKVKEATEIRKQLGDPFYIISDLLQLSVLYKDLGRFDLGIQMAREALRVANDNHITTQDYSIASVLWENYYESKRYKEAAEQISEMLSIISRNNETATADAIAELEVKYETDKKELLIKKQQLELDRKNFLLYGSIVLLLLLMVTLYFVYLNYKNRQARKLKDAVIKEQHQAAKAVILAQEHERSQLSQHLHDGVGQTLSGLKMNLQALDERVETKEEANIFENSMALLDDAIYEIRNISHRLMPNNIVRLGLKNALHLLTEKIRSDKLNIYLEMDADVDKMEPDIQLIIYRVIQESINNVIRHSGARTLQITFHIRNNRLHVSIADDGVGFDTSDILKHSGIGLNNIYTRIRFLQGNIRIKSEPRQGTQVNFDIPFSPE